MKSNLTDFNSEVLYREMTDDWQAKSHRLQARRWRKLLRDQAS